MIRLSKELVLQIHENLLKEYGGQSGFIDENLFLSQCEMPYQTFDGEELFPDIYDKAVRYLFGFASNQAFQDGNKRTGVMVMLIFLDINGIKIKASQEELIKLGMDVATNNIGDIEAKEFLIAHTM